MKKRAVRYSFLLLAILWMGLIFGFSSQSATESGGLSAYISEPVTNWLASRSGELSSAERYALYLRVDNFVRKTAHFTEYAILGMLLTAVLRAFGIKKAWISWLIGAVYAVTDEWHQSYSPGRASQITVVLIDAAGVLCGVAIYYLAKYIWRRLHVHHQ